MTKRKKYYKVVVLVAETVTVIKKEVFVNVRKCVMKGGTLHIIRDSGSLMYIDGDMDDYFMKPQKRWIDDGTKIRRGSTKVSKQV